MLFNLFKKKKDDETDVGGVKVRTGAAATPTPRPAPQRQVSSFNNRQTTPSTRMLSDRLMNNQNLVSGRPNYKAPQSLTPALDSLTGKNMQQRFDDISTQAKERVMQPKPPPQPELPKPQFDPMGRYQQLGQDRQSLLDQRKQQGEKYLNEAYGERQRYLQDYIPRLQQQFAQAKAGVEEGIGLAEGDAAMARDRAEDDWGTAQRQAAMTRRESEARTAGQFANLNTSDSYGFGSHGQAQENIESDFNRFTQEGLKQKQQNFHEIERALQDYTLQARQQINQMESSLNEAVMQIESDMNMNDIEKRNAISQLAIDYQDGVLAIQENLQDIQYQYEMAQQEMAKTQLSPEFMQTGVPQNENDYRFYMDNYDQYEEMLGGGQSGEVMARRGDTVALIDDVLNQGRTKPLTGNLRLQGVPLINRMAVADTKAKLQQIQSQLEMAAAEMMKGQGQISEGEREIMRNAVLALNPDKRGTYRISDEQLRRTLEQAKNILQRQGAIQTGATQVNPNQFIR
ncbi:hypothetical protein KO465_07530 [Candidatus Micrarchaeota archaeon]|nr:hypothetical protein [Candidatus Micrarchaeota archaeon]